MALKIYFGSLASDFIKDSGREIQDVAASLPKTPASQFSKWRAGKWSYIAERKLVPLIQAIAKNNKEMQAKLMIAYLIDMTPEIFRPVVDIMPRVGEEAVEPLDGKRWSPSLRARIEAIGNAYARDDNFMRMVDQLGKWAESINKEHR